MIEVSISNLILTVGIFFLIGLGIGCFSMVMVTKRELEKLEDDLFN